MRSLPAPNSKQTRTDPMDDLLRDVLGGDDEPTPEVVPQPAAAPAPTALIPANDHPASRLAVALPATPRLSDPLAGHTDPYEDGEPAATAPEPDDDEPAAEGQPQANRWEFGRQQAARVVAMWLSERAEASAPRAIVVTSEYIREVLRRFTLDAELERDVSDVLIKSLSESDMVMFRVGPDSFAVMLRAVLERNSVVLTDNDLPNDARGASANKIGARFSESEQLILKMLGAAAGDQAKLIRQGVDLQAAMHSRGIDLSTLTAEDFEAAAAALAARKK